MNIYCGLCGKTTKYSEENKTCMHCDKSCAYCICGHCGKNCVCESCGGCLKCRECCKCYECCTCTICDDTDEPITEPVSPGKNKKDNSYRDLLEWQRRSAESPGGRRPKGGTDEPSEEGWEMYYIYNGNPSFTNFNIPLEAFIGWDGTQRLTDDIYKNNASDVELWANNPRCGSTAKTSFDEDTAEKIPFNERSDKPSIPGTIKKWFFNSKAGAVGSIAITGSSSGYDIPIKIIKKGSDI